MKNEKKLKIISPTYFLFRYFFRKKTWEILAKK
jgi:hypothetical protein